MIRDMQPGDHGALVNMIAEFRVTLSRFLGRAKSPDYEAAEAELAAYDPPKFHVLVAESEDERLCGFAVCRSVDDELWVDVLYVVPEFRRQGIGTALFQEAENFAAEQGSQTVFNWVHPNNDRMIGFLRKQGYYVLNRIEVRKARPGESYLQRINVGKNVFEYCC